MNIRLATLIAAKTLIETCLRERWPAGGRLPTDAEIQRSYEALRAALKYNDMAGVDLVIRRDEETNRLQVEIWYEGRVTIA